VVAYTSYASPIGELLLTSDGTALTGVWMDGVIPDEEVCDPALPVFQEAICWLDAYFTGLQPEPTFPIKPEGTAFQLRVWEILAAIPFGQTRTYGELAREIGAITGRKMSPQAVGQAVGRNPVSILIPCHRVIGAGRKLTGYAGGLDRKAWLLRHEGIEF